MQYENLNNLQDEKLLIEIRDMINGIDSVKDNIDEYCRFLKDMFLSGSGRN